MQPQQPTGREPLHVSHDDTSEAEDLIKDEILGEQQAEPISLKPYSSKVGLSSALADDRRYNASVVSDSEDSDHEDGAAETERSWHQAQEAAESLFLVNQGMLDGIRNLDGENQEEDEHEAWVKAERARKKWKRRSAGTKRTLAQSIGSDTDDELASHDSQRLSQRSFLLTESSNSNELKGKANEQQPKQRGDPLGLTILYEPVGVAKADIVFVHGLGGSSIKSWCKNNDLDLFWPRKFLRLDPDICHARIMTFGYNTASPSTGDAISNISGFATDLLRALKFIKDEKQGGLNIGSVPLFFVAYSVGGLVVKKLVNVVKAFVQGRDHPEYQEMIKSISAIMFLSTQHRVISPLELNRRIAEASVSFGESQPSIPIITKDPPKLQDINEQFRYIASPLKLFSFFGTRPDKIGVTNAKLAPSDQCVLDLPGESKIALDADHKGMSKFDSIEDPNYILVRNALKLAVSEAIARYGSTARGETGELESLFAIPVEQGESIADDVTSSTRSKWVNKSTMSGFSRREDAAPSIDSGYVLWKSQTDYKMPSNGSNFNQERPLADLEEVEEDAQSQQSVENIGDGISSIGESFIDNDIQEIAQSLILEVLEDDEVLPSLVKKSLEKFDRHRVVKNLAGFIFGYCVLLNNAQPTLNQKRTIRFFRRRRTQFASILCNNLDPFSLGLKEKIAGEKSKALVAERKVRLALWMTDEPSNVSPTPSVDGDAGDISGDESWGDSEGLPHVLEDIKGFLTDGEPLELFRQNFARFAAGESIKDWNLMIKSKLPLHQVRQLKETTTSITSSSSLSITESSLSSEAKKDDNIVEIDNDGGFYVSWNCRCGRKFKARIAGSDRRAAEDFLQRMNWNVKRDGPKVTHCFKLQWLENLLWVLAPNLLDRFSFELRGMGTESEDLEAGGGLTSQQPELNPPARSHQDPVRQIGINLTIDEADAKRDLVYVCLVNRESNNWRLKHAKVYRSLNIKTLETQEAEARGVTQNMDKALFLALRERLVRRLKGNSWFSPLTITGLEFWEFKLFYTAKLVTRVKKDKLPYESQTTEPEAPDAVPAAQLEEWEYTPLTGHRLSSYKYCLQSEFLLHLLKFPGDALPESPVWTGLPRKIRTKLINRQPTPKLGWGFSVDHEWNTLAFTVSMCPIIIAGFVLAIYLAIRYKWPVSAAITLALAPVTLIAFLDTMLKGVLKQKSLSK
ncbi:hypothetical protein N431DRAFT_513570 [Stipitochalara longipes BDJ]|nr:hypothetical protein N431DRAFT_513570 [Stipitochalara longipes BDJ]